MPTIDVTICPLMVAKKQQLVVDLTDVFVAPDTPAEWVTILFRHIEANDFARDRRLPLLDGKSGLDGASAGDDAVPGPGIVDITIGPLDEAEKRRIAAGVAEALLAIGVPEMFISIHFRHVTGRDIAEANGRFPFRPLGSTW